MDLDTSRTSASLLARLRRLPADQGAWGEFVHRYGTLVHGWCRRWHLQDADADDVTQTVLLGLAERMKEFHYDAAGSFRAWLRVVAQHALTRWQVGRQRSGRGTGSEQVAALIETQEARADFVARLEEEYDRELFEVAVGRVRLRVEPHTWEAFRLMVLEDLPGAEVAQRLNMNVATVYVAKGRVQKLLADAVRALDREA